MTEEVKAVVVISGGLDSSTLLHLVRRMGYECYGISFDYGQRHKKELEFAKKQCDIIGASHKIVDLSSLTDLLAESGSSLVTDTDVPEGHYGEESMKSTVVPNRNMIMASIAAGYAVSIDAVQIAMGMHAGDHFIYPDCRPEFVNATEYAIREGNMGFAHEQFHFHTPFIRKSKNDIAMMAYQLEVPIDQTWSCYNGNEKHCGKCGTCVERLEALDFAHQQNEEWIDPTEYEDNEYWREALKRETV